MFGKLRPWSSWSAVGVLGSLEIAAFPGVASDSSPADSETHQPRSREGPRGAEDEWETSPVLCAWSSENSPR